MGNKLGRRRQVVDEKYTKPQGLYQHKDVDNKKLKKLILESKLAPCYPGDEDCTCDLEECPICFLYYPTLNRSRCCLKSICTECFLQMKMPNSTLPTQCPFCKTSNYAVEYRGAKTKEERGIEQIEEQRFIEAKIRMRQQEVHDEQGRTQKRLGMSSSGSMMGAMNIECSSPLQTEEIISAQDSSDATPARQHLHSRQNRDDEFDLDLEDIMVMEAVWLSIQENANSSGQHLASDYHITPVMAPLVESPSPPPSSSPSGGLACAIAALAERQQINGGESSTIHNENSRNSNWVTKNGDWNADCGGSEVADPGTSYASSDSVTAPLQSDEIESCFHNNVPGPGPIMPENYEEQMMLAMAVSLAEARVMPSAQGVVWH